MTGSPANRRPLPGDLELGIHPGPVVPGDVADQLVASRRQGDGGPAGGSGNDAIALVGAAAAFHVAEAGRLVDLVVGLDAPLADVWPAPSGNTVSSWIQAPVLTTRNDT